MLIGAALMAAPALAAVPRTVMLEEFGYFT
jgi:hypothetical protein